MGQRVSVCSLNRLTASGPGRRHGRPWLWSVPGGPGTRPSHVHQSARYGPRAHLAAVKRVGAQPPTGYPLRSGVPGSLVGDRVTVTMTNFASWALRNRLATGPWDWNDVRRGIFACRVTFVFLRTSS